MMTVGSFLDSLPIPFTVEAGVQLDLIDAAAEVDVDAVAAAARFLDGPVRAPEAPVVHEGGYTINPDHTFNRPDGSLLDDG